MLSEFCFYVLCVGVDLFLLASAHRASAQPATDKPVSFINDVAPILKENCFTCHDSSRQSGKYDMTTFEKLMAGGANGKPIDAGNPETSEFYTLIVSAEDRRMPPRNAGEGVPKDKTAIVARWIKEGAKFDNGLDVKADLEKELRVRSKPPLAKSFPSSIQPRSSGSAHLKTSLNPPPNKSTTDREETPVNLTAAKALFVKYCQSCHGVDGRGKELRANMPVLPDFTNQEWQERNSTAQLVVGILDGKGKLMPAFRGRVTEQQARELATFIKSLGPRGSSRPNNPTEEFQKRFRELEEEWKEIQRQLKALEKPSPKRE